ncbi:hypothetical protein EDC55_12015 [Allofrancisella inopinata]|uniref:Methyltransferase family protein n=1 Tax=Allofrancisella inopinata TaxID=1085647 RepID=A0AAE6YJ65_9GAMM|nr:hypothetical protein [Allofrancisella inopinata]QIV96506.1 hypothetical protein E4K63_06550 [Allofrancisella inopinata]TDT68500.1 hypothetical protein EDC55_12015 [Allofrancisella inopinata]
MEDDKNTKLMVDVENLAKEKESLQKALADEDKKISQKDGSIQDFLDSHGVYIPEGCLNTLSYENKIEVITSYCMKQSDVLGSIDAFVLESEVSDEEKFDICCSFATKIKEYGDRNQGVSYMNNARYFLSDKDQEREKQYKKLIKLAVLFDEVALAVDLEMEYSSQFWNFADDINRKVSEEYKKIRAASFSKQEHGQALLIDYIEKNVKDGEGFGKTLVEIGTTRENVPGQGSTLQLARLCKRKGIKFITVDMDAHNVRWASFLSKKYDLNIKAVTRKGEEFLKNDIEDFDFVFLDAYDFDHGGHSSLRQSRYEKYLDGKIDEKKSHKMHLECAKSVVEKLKKDGVVCVDDTWQDEVGAWMAKGALAIPYLIEKNFKILEQKNRAVLMRYKDR